MPLPKPTLDNRSYDQLVAEGRSLMPRLAPSFTDQNASDPSITLLELGAWLAEQNIYRFDRVSDEALRAFVRLVGIEPRMAAVARTVVSVANGNAAGLRLPERMQLADAAGVARFETTQALFVSPASLVRVAVGAASLVDVTVAHPGGTGFDAFGPRPRPGHALYLGFDRPLDAAGETLALQVWTASWRADAATREALRAEHAERTAQGKGRCVPPDWRAHYRVRTVWEFDAGAAGWKPLVDVEDETRALSLSGFVRFTAPVGHQPRAPGAPCFIRCRIVRGRFECPPRLRHVAFNAVPCEHATSIAEQPVGQARGHAAAGFELGQEPAVAGSVRLRLEDAGGTPQGDWREVPDFERAGPFDEVFTLDPERAVIRSGDGLRGAILPAGHRILASYRVGGGPMGNVDPGTLATVPANAANLALLPALGSLATPLAVVQPVAAEGGTVRETLASAQARAHDKASSVDKAVTVDDIERIALETPGVPVARVRAVPGLHALLPCYPAPGVVTLIVIPPCPRPAPMPSRDLLDAVERHLDARRLVTSEIRAIAPRYRRVGVTATLHLACDTDAGDVVRAAQAALARFLDPLDGGPEGSGWPFGRTVYRTEVMALLADVPGVARVTSLSLHAGFGGVSDEVCGNVPLCPHELVMPGEQRLVIESETASNLKRSHAHEC